MTNSIRPDDPDEPPVNWRSLETSCRAEDHEKAAAMGHWVIGDGELRRRCDVKQGYPCKSVRICKGVRVSIRAKKRGNARGAKGHRKVNA